jgi:hypothetical protein
MGKLFDESGQGLTPSHVIKNGRRYRYYISRHLIIGPADKNKTGWRLPAQEIEQVTVKAVRSILSNHNVINACSNNDWCICFSYILYNRPCLPTLRELNDVFNALTVLKTLLSYMTCNISGELVFLKMALPMQKNRQNNFLHIRCFNAGNAFSFAFGSIGWM